MVNSLRQLGGKTKKNSMKIELFSWSIELSSKKVRFLSFEENIFCRKSQGIGETFCEVS